MIRIGAVMLMAFATTAAAGEFNDVCGVPERNVETIQVVDEGRGADDPRKYDRGWWSMRAVSDTLIQPWGGNSHDPSGDNSIRRYNVATDSWEMIHPDVGDYFLDTSTTDIWKDAAYELWGNPEYILDNRDNHLYFYIPDRNEMLIYGVPAANISWGGVYDLDTEQWTHMWRSFADMGTQGYLKPPDVKKASMAWGMNAAHVWVDPDGPGGEVGMGLAFGGARYSSDTSILFRIVPSDEPGYVFEMQEIRGARTAPPATGNNRNGVVAAGSCAYFFGGRHRGKGSTGAVWRYNTANGRWARMADMPVATQWNAAAFDPATNRVVVLTGSAPLHVLAYDLEEDSWSEITAEIPGLPAGASQPTLEHAYGRYVAMARQWDLNGDGNTRSSTSHLVYRFVVAAKTYERPEITKVYGPEGKGQESYNQWPAKANKHTTWAWNPSNNRYYSAGGDFAGSPNNQSYRQEIYSYEPATDTWRLELPYCVPDGEVSWQHPDVVGWTWDASREVLWFVPGMMPARGEFCDIGTYYRYQVLKFDPKTGKFTRPPQPPPNEFPGNKDEDSFPDLGGDPIYHAVYVPGDDILLKIGNTNRAIFDIEAGTWDVAPLVGESKGNFRWSTLSVLGGNVYLSASNKLFRYDLDQDRMFRLGKTPEGAGQFKLIGRSLVSYPSWTKPEHRKLWIYDLVTGTWASTPPIRNTATTEDPDLIGCRGYNGCFGVGWTVSEERAEMFVFGEQRSYNDPYDHFYLIDLSFLPGASVTEPIAPPPHRLMATPSGEPERRKSKASAAAGKPEARQPSQAAASPEPKRPTTTPQRQKSDPPPRPPSNNLPPPGRIIMEADVGKAYNLPGSSRLRKGAVDAADSSRQDSR